MSHPKKVAPKVAIPMLINGSVGTNFVMVSARSGTSEKATTAPTVDAAEVMMEEARAYRRLLVRRRKKVFQSRSWGAAEAEVAEEVDEEVDAFRARHRDGVKKDDGVFVVGGLAAKGVNLDKDR